MGSCFSVSLSLDSLILRCWDCAADRAHYVRRLEDNVGALKRARDELAAKRNDVMGKVRSEDGQEMELTREVQNWVESVGTLVTQVDLLLEASPQEIENLCLGGYCSRKYTSSYKFGVDVFEKLKVVEGENNRVFNEVVVKMPPKHVVQQNVGDTIGLKSMLDEAWRYLMGDGEQQVETLGIYGMGGVGKTTLLKEINNKFESCSNDYLVMFVTVSKDYQIDKLQDAIWECLGYSVDDSWKKKTCNEKVQALFSKLSKKKFVLLLDDVWKPIDLAEDIGVPENRNGSKVVITSRYQNVCSEMGSRRGLKIKPLEQEEGRQLFCKMIPENTLSAHPEIPSLAQEVIKECAGLPIAIKTIGRAMSSKKTPQEWRLAIQRLRNCPSEVDKVEKEILHRLKFSYDTLSSKKLQSCFLYCCLFPEDFEIDKDALIDYWICEDLCSSRDEGYDIIGTLVHACLLEGGEESCVKLHDAIRDMALWISTSDQGEEENEKFLVKAGCELTEIAEMERWKGKKRISFMSNKIEVVKGVPTCPNLLTLLLNKNEELEAFKGGFFQSMNALKVLDISDFNQGRRIRALPSFPIEILQLTCLQYLNLSRSQLVTIPPELKMLVKLKYLNVDWNVDLDIPREVISSLKLLQVLRMYRCGSNNDFRNFNVWSIGYDFVQELMCLEHLNVLSMTIKEESTLQSVSNNPRLATCIQALEIAHMSDLKSLNLSSLLRMVQLKELFMYNAINLEDMKVESRLVAHAAISSIASFNSLRTVWLSACRSLLDLTWLILVPNLTSLKVFSCLNLKEIISAEKSGEISDHGNFFGKLKRIELGYLDKLESIYDKSLSFPSLEIILITRCPKLKKLPLNSNSAKERRLEIRGPKDWWNDLEWEDEAAKTTFYSSFCEISWD